MKTNTYLPLSVLKFSLTVNLGECWQEIVGGMGKLYLPY